MINIIRWNHHYVHIFSCAFPFRCCHAIIFIGNNILWREDKILSSFRAYWKAKRKFRGLKISKNYKPSLCIWLVVRIHVFFLAPDPSLCLLLLRLLRAVEDSCGEKAVPASSSSPPLLSSLEKILLLSEYAGSYFFNSKKFHTQIYWYI